MGMSYPGPRDVWVAPPSLRNIKYTGMHHFYEKNSLKISPQRVSAKMFGGENVSPGPAVALDGPEVTCCRVQVTTRRNEQIKPDQADESSCEYCN